MDTCSIETCDSPVRSRGWCRSHYEKWRRHGDPEAVVKMGGNRNRPPVLPTRLCTDCNEIKPIDEYYVTSKGWTYRYCKACHKDRMTANRLQKRLDNPPKPKEKVDHGECAFDGCTNKARVRLKNGPTGWYCMSHLHQWRARAELRPLRTFRKSHIDENFRRCTKCNKVKAVTQFHTRGKGKGRQSACKECYYRVVKFNTLLKQERYAEAAVVVEDMPDNQREQYKARLQAAQEEG